jgi:hypothetical protein
MGRSAAIEAEGPVDPPAGLTDDEWSAFVAGAGEGLAVGVARLEAMELKARFELGELAEARVATEGEYRD